MLQISKTRQVSLWLEFIACRAASLPISTNYIGLYDVLCSSASNQFNSSCDAFPLSLFLTDQVVDGCGGYLISGKFTDNIPIIGSADHIFMDGQSDIYGNYLTIVTDNYNFLFTADNWNPMVAFSSSEGYAIYFDEFECLQSGINIGAQQLLLFGH